MATQLTSAYCDASTYPTFAAWAKWAMAAFTTFGWNQTADTGQVNWTNLATSNVVPIGSSATAWASSTAALAIGTGAAGVACVAGSGALVIAVASTTGFYAGKAVALGAYNANGTILTGTAGIANLNGLLFTIASIVANTSITLTVPTTGAVGTTSWSAGFSYTATAGTLYLQPAFSIFYAADTLAYMSPIYVKVEFAQYATTTSPWCRIQISTTGTNGYGSLLGVVSAPFFAVNNQASDNANLRPCYASGNAGNIRFLLTAPIGVGTSDLYTGLWVVISRSKDTGGNDTGTYICMWAGNNYQLSTAQTVFSAGGTNTVDTSGYLIGLCGGFSGASAGAWGVGGVSTVTPIFQNIGGFTNPNQDFLGGSPTDFKNGTFAAISVYGTPHNYIVWEASSAMPHLGPVTTPSLLFRFE